MLIKFVYLSAWHHQLSASSAYWHAFICYIFSTYIYVYICCIYIFYILLLYLYCYIYYVLSVTLHISIFLSTIKKFDEIIAIAINVALFSA